MFARTSAGRLTAPGATQPRGIIYQDGISFTRVGGVAEYLAGFRCRWKLGRGGERAGGES